MKILCGNAKRQTLQEQHEEMAFRAINQLMLLIFYSAHFLCKKVFFATGRDELRIINEVTNNLSRIVGKQGAAIIYVITSLAQMGVLTSHDRQF